jgi:hypothetical protein
MKASELIAALEAIMAQQGTELLAFQGDNGLAGSPYGVAVFEASATAI